MARLCFIGFDFDPSGGLPTNTSTGSTGDTTLDLALPPNCKFIRYNSDSTLDNPGDAFRLCQVNGYNANSSALGYINFDGNNSLNNLGGTVGCAVPASYWGANDEVFVHLRWVTSCGTTANSGDCNTPATYERSETRFQLFKWGDLSIRTRSNVRTSSTNSTITFELFNGVTSLGTHAVTCSHAQWAFVKIRARLHNGSGRLDLTVDGSTVSFTGLNSVATTALASVTYMYFSGAPLGIVASNGIRIYGAIDDILINDTAFESTKPYGRRLTLSSDGTQSGWSAQGGASTLVGGLSGTGSAKGTGSGAYANLNHSTFSTTGLSAVIGYQLLAVGVSNLDADTARKLKLGINDGTVYYDSFVQTQVPATSPSTTTFGMVGVFYGAGGTTDFDLTNAGAGSIQVRVEVTP